MVTKMSVLKTSFYGIDFSKYSSKVAEFVSELESRANKQGYFLNWVNLPQEQLKRLDDLYLMAENFKKQTNAEKLSVMGIGGSKHTVEHMLSINGLNINSDKVEFYSDVDSISLERFLTKLNHDVTNSNFMIASKSGSTFETKDGFLRVQQMLVEAYMSKGQSEAKEKILTEGFRQDVPISHGYLDGVGGTYFALDLKNGQDYGSVVKAKFKGKVAHLNTTLVEYILKPYLKQKTNNLKIIKNAHFPDSMTIEDSIVLRYLQNKLKQMGYDGIVNNYSFAAGCQYFSALDPSLIQIIK